VFRLPQFSNLGLTALGAEARDGSNLGSIRRDMWEDYFDQVVRLQGVGTPVVPLDSQVKNDFTPTPVPFQVEFRSNKKNNSFEVGDQMSFVVTNKSAKNLFVELVATSISGRKVVILEPTILKPGKELRYPPAGQALEVRGQLGKEHYTLFASEQKFPAGQVLRGRDVTDRIVHPFYELRRETNGRIEPVFDPATMVKKTLEIETR
jgi:serine/threonine-protein kinase